MVPLVDCVGYQQLGLSPPPVVFSVEFFGRSFCTDLIKYIGIASCWTDGGQLEIFNTSPYLPPYWQCELKMTYLETFSAVPANWWVIGDWLSVLSKVGFRSNFSSDRFWWSFGPFRISVYQKVILVIGVGQVIHVSILHRVEFWGRLILFILNNNDNKKLYLYISFIT